MEKPDGNCAGFNERGQREKSGVTVAGRVDGRTGNYNIIAVQALLEKGAEVNAPGYNGFTVLMYATK